jgi:hypothetical protein
MPIIARNSSILGFFYLILPGVCGNYGREPHCGRISHERLGNDVFMLPLPFFSGVWINRLFQGVNIHGFYD